MGVPEDLARGSLRFSLRAHLDGGRRRRGRRGHRPGRRARAPRRPERRTRRPPTMRVLAAMSGGVDSAVAAARAVDAGHDVTGVHLALSSNPQSFRSGARGCCTLEDARDARRAADVIGIPFYVWDLAERFREDVVDDFVAEYAAGRTPNPCLRCNEKIKFAAVLDKALGARFRRRLHRSLRPHRRRPAAPGRRRGQGPVLRARRAHRRPAGARDVPARRRPTRPRSAPRPTGAGSRSPTSRTATTSASSPTATPVASCATASASRPGRSSTPTARRSASTTAPSRSRSASAEGCASAGRPPTASRATSSTSRR